MSDSLKYDFMAIRISTATGVIGFVHLGPFSEWGYTIWLIQEWVQPYVSRCIDGATRKDWTREDAYSAMKKVFDLITQTNKIVRMEQEKQDVIKFTAEAIENAS